MASRRASTNSTPPLPNLGTPYQLFHEIVSSGRNVAGSKTKVKWQYGWSNNIVEHCVEFKVSFLTGNKRIYSDGVEVFSGGSLLETEFDHTWPQDGHMMRIECSLGVTTDSEFKFLIDSVTYNNFILKSALPKDCAALGGAPVAGSGSTTIKGFGSSGSSSAGGSTGSTAAGTAHRRGSSSNGSAGSSSGSTSRNNNNSTVDPFASSGDPFGESDFGSSDPFAAPTSSAVSSNNPFSTNASGNSNASSFDPFGSSASSPKSNMKPPRPPSAVKASTPLPAASPAATFDLFDDAPSNVNSSGHSNSNNNDSDPFAPSPAQQQNEAFDPFGSSPTPAPIPAASTPVMDLFSAPASADPFAEQIQKTVVDFSNISFTPPKAPKDTTVTPIAAQPVVQPVVQPHKDTYNGLVNLDFGSNSQKRRPSLGLSDHNNPPLHSMMASGGGARRMSMQLPSGGGNPFAANNSSNNNAGLNGSTNGNSGRSGSISGSTNLFNGSMNIGQQATAGSNNRRQSMTIARGNDVTSLYNPQGQSSQKSSLDSLDWKM